MRGGGLPAGGPTAQRQAGGGADATNASRLETLQNLYNEVVDQKDGLADQVKQLQGELELYREQAASGEAGSQALKAELEQLEITAGLTDVEGPGVTIILEDSSQANVTGNEADYLIHDNDLLSVINELRSAGARPSPSTESVFWPPARCAALARW